MKITKRQLRRIIKEEKAKLLKEAPRHGEDYADVDDQDSQSTLSPTEWAAAAYDDLFQDLVNAFAVAKGAGVIADDIDDAVRNAKAYVDEAHS